MVPKSCANCKRRCQHEVTKVETLTDFDRLTSLRGGPFLSSTKIFNTAVSYWTRRTNWAVHGRPRPRLRCRPGSTRPLTLSIGAKYSTPGHCTAPTFAGR